MRTCLGAAAQLKDPSQLPVGWAEGISWLHCEGYCLHRPDIALAAMRAAHSAGAQVGPKSDPFRRPMSSLVCLGVI